VEAKVKSEKPLKSKSPIPMTKSVAEQIAHLLNQHNSLQTPYTGDKVIGAKAKYHPIQHEGLVFGSVATHRLNFMLTEVKHLVVHPTFRKMGLGHKLIKTAMGRADTPVIYATIRKDNTASLYLFEKAGFRVISTAKIKDHETHFLIKENETYHQDSTESAGNFTSPTRKTRHPLGGALGAWE
jgi:ribosomal protein S18 acetylase RimI-like enzyme